VAASYAPLNGAHGCHAVLALSILGAAGAGLCLPPMGITACRDCRSAKA